MELYLVYYKWQQWDVSTTGAEDSNTSHKVS